MTTHGKHGTIEDVLSVIELAKLTIDDLRPAIQQFRFSDDLRSSELKLVELDSGMAEIILSGGQVVIKGEANELAVLCTESDTFDVKDAETSNSLLILPSLILSHDTPAAASTVNPVSVVAVARNYLELRRIKPKVKKLRTLLDQSAYSGPAIESDSVKKYSESDLIELIQASEKEIRASLVKNNVFYLNGYVRVLEFDYESRVFSSITMLLEESGWNYESIPCGTCISILEDTYPPFVLEHVLKTYADGNKDSTCRLVENKTCLFFAKLLLVPTQKFNLSEFLSSWQLCVPNGMNTALNQLEGIALIDRACKPEEIRYFNVESLSEDPNERFQELFLAKEKWSFEEIRPYIEELCVEKMTVSALLTKYCRTSMLNGSKVYSSKLKSL